MRIVGMACLLAGLVGCAAPPPPRYVAPAYPYGYRAYPAYAPGLATLPEDARSRTAARTPARPRPTVAAATPPSPTAAPPTAPPAASPIVTPAAASAGGPECRTVTQVGYADGREVQRQERFCRAAPGREWVRS